MSYPWSFYREWSFCILIMHFLWGFRGELCDSEDIQCCCSVSQYFWRMGKHVIEINTYNSFCDVAYGQIAWHRDSLPVAWRGVDWAFLLNLVFASGGARCPPSLSGHQRLGCHTSRFLHCINSFPCGGGGQGHACGHDPPWGGYQLCILLLVLFNS